jgi:hypothetical protein
LTQGGHQWGFQNIGPSHYDASSIRLGEEHEATEVIVCSQQRGNFLVAAC